MIRRVYTAGPFRDETNTYDIILDKDYTVCEFINEIIANNSDEWGKFCIVRDHTRRQTIINYECKYENGSIADIDADILRNKYYDKKVLCAYATGGWSYMEYSIYV